MVLLVKLTDSDSASWNKYVNAVDEISEPSFVGMKKKKKKPVSVYISIWFLILFEAL